MTNTIYKECKDSVVIFEAVFCDVDTLERNPQAPKPGQLFPGGLYCSVSKYI